MKVGLFDHVEHGGRPLATLFDERIVFARAADDAGIYCLHVAEHHATPLNMVPVPGVYLGAVARATRRMRLGPLVYLLPLYSPLRLIEEICMLDHLTRGRLELGVGRGVSPYEVSYYGRDAARTRSMFEEALAVVVAGLTSDRLTHKGVYYQYADVPLELSPRQRPYPEFWYATSNLDSVAWAATNGMHMVGLGPARAYRPFVERYAAVWPQHKNDPGRLNPHVSAPRIGISRQVVVADTDGEAEAIARAAHPRWAASFVKLWADHGDTSRHYRVDLDDALREETILTGSPPRVRAQVARLIETTGVNYVICSFAWGDLSLAQSLRSLRLFAGEVMPAFQA